MLYIYNHTAQASSCFISTIIQPKLLHALYLPSYSPSFFMLYIYYHTAQASSCFISTIIQPKLLHALYLQSYNPSFFMLYIYYHAACFISTIMQPKLLHASHLLSFMRCIRIVTFRIKITIPEYIPLAEAKQPKQIN